MLKTGFFPEITEEYGLISEKKKSSTAEYVNAIDYNGNLVNVLRFRERKIIN